MTHAPPAETAAEDLLLRAGAALVERPASDLLELAGPDRLRFLNGLVTCEVKGLGAGAGRYGFFTDLKGRVLADVTVLALDDRLVLELPAGSGPAMAAHLRKYVIADRVEVAEQVDRTPVTLAGPRAATVLAGELPIEPWSHHLREIAGASVVLVREGRLGVEAFTCWTSASTVPAVRSALEALPGVGRASSSALDAERIRAGIGRFGQDFGPEHFPQETGAGAMGVSYTKGCYLGQEIVARIHYRGGVQRGLRGLRFAGDPPPLGTAVLAEGRESGTVTSLAVTPDLGTIGLAVLHQRVGVAGSSVELSSGGAAVVVDLPFA